MIESEYETGPSLSVAFTGRDDLVRIIDEALAHEDRASFLERLSAALERLLRTDRIRLPSNVLAQNPDHYSRRELYRSPRFGYCIVAMVWAPGQGTPIHDHDELWCVEGIWRGVLEITPYELLEVRDQDYRFRKAESVQIGAGETAHLAPPHEYHVVRNPSGDQVTVSIHIYQSPLARYARFEPTEGEWFRRAQSMLEIDPSEP